MELRRSRNSKPLSETVIFWLVILVSFVVAFLVVTNKQDVILLYASATMSASLFFLVRKIRQRDALQKTWQYDLVRFVCVFLPFSLFLTRVSSMQGIPVGVKLLISAGFSGMAIVRGHFASRLKDKRDT